MHPTLGELAFLILSIGGIALYGVTLFLGWLFVSAAKTPSAPTASKAAPEAAPTAPAPMRKAA